MKKIISLIFVGLLIFNSYLAVGMSINTNTITESEILFVDDFDPLVDVNITIEILEIRAIDKIECDSDPDFFVKIFINGEEFISPVWEDSLYLYDDWTVTTDVPDDYSKVNITIQLWDWNSDEDLLCDISKDENYDNEGFGVNVTYDISSGRWTGDDYNIGDGSGYGRVCGSGDGSIYEDENDCELWFNIYQNDYDDDNLPYWVETNVYGTDPEVDDTGMDEDLDGIPIEWEHRFGFNPFIWDDHENYDPDDDSLNNTEEFLTFDFGTDPFRRDILLEIDFMEGGPDDVNNSVSNKAYELMKVPFHRRNIVIHIDDGEVYGGDLIPFDDYVSTSESRVIYDNYFIKDESEAWRRGVFHYGIIVYKCKPAGYAFSGGIPGWGYGRGTNAFIISSSMIDHFQNLILYFKSRDREFLYAANIMHEMGHNFGIRFGNPLGCDLSASAYPWRLSFWIFRTYKSNMNYRYTYLILDYSDGSHGRRDFDDWEHIDLSHFEIPDKIYPKFK
jgi:hypothetical protein